jgi:hypothetical protein
MSTAEASPRPDDASEALSRFWNDSLEQADPESSRGARRARRASATGSS